MDESGYNGGVLLGDFPCPLHVTLGPSGMDHGPPKLAGALVVIAWRSGGCIITKKGQ